eukprot:scaffold125634_cov21-Prasinocladus_malaysianus.AAC.2
MATRGPADGAKLVGACGNHIIECTLTPLRLWHIFLPWLCDPNHAPLTAAFGSNVKCTPFETG